MTMSKKESTEPVRHVEGETYTTLPLLLLAVLALAIVGIVLKAIGVF
jgi:hypothetical protein